MKQPFTIKEESIVSGKGELLFVDIRGKGQENPYKRDKETGKNLMQYQASIVLSYDDAKVIWDKYIEMTNNQYQLKIIGGQSKEIDLIRTIDSHRWIKIYNGKDEKSSYITSIEEFVPNKQYVIRAVQNTFHFGKETEISCLKADNSEQDLSGGMFITNGSIGRLRFMMRTWCIDPNKIGVSLYLDAVKLIKPIWYQQTPKKDFDVEETEEVPMEEKNGSGQGVGIQT